MEGQGRGADAGPRRTAVLRSATQKLSSYDTHSITVHQSMRTLKLTSQQLRWRESWASIGFQLRMVDDAAARADIEQLVSATGRSDFLRVYDALETSVQRNDFWRYAILWLRGGVYSDIDVSAYPEIAVLLASTTNPIIFTESLPLFDWLPGSLAAAIGWLANRLGFTDLARLPQRRNCVMVSPARHALMLRTLNLIVSRFDAGFSGHQIAEPQRTLELTGPAVFTDALQQLQREDSEQVHAMRFISRYQGMQYFEHFAQGSWKTYLDPNVHGGEKQHELLLRRSLLFLQVGMLLAYWLCNARVWRRARQHTCDREERRSSCVQLLRLAVQWLKQRLQVRSLRPKNDHFAASSLCECRDSKLGIAMAWPVRYCNFIDLEAPYDRTCEVRFYNHPDGTGCSSQCKGCERVFVTQSTRTQNKTHVQSSRIQGPSLL